MNRVREVIRPRLKDIYFTACRLYTEGIAENDIIKQEKSKAIFDVYRLNGGMEELKII